jgi:hypothetical protein
MHERDPFSGSIYEERAHLAEYALSSYIATDVRPAKHGSRQQNKHDYSQRIEYMPRIARKDITPTVQHKPDTDTGGPTSGDGGNLLGLLVALGAGIAFGLVLAVCFLEGQGGGAASVRISVSDSSLAVAALVGKFMIGMCLRFIDWRAG